MKPSFWRLALVLAISALAINGCRRNTDDTLDEQEAQSMATGSDAVSESYDVADQAVNISGIGKNGEVNAGDFNGKTDGVDFAGTRWGGCATAVRDSVALANVVPASLQASFSANRAVKRIVVSFSGACTDNVVRNGNIVVYWQGDWWGRGTTPRVVRIWSGTQAPYSVYTVRGTQHYINKLIQAVPFTYSASATGFPTHNVSVNDSLVFGTNTAGQLITATYRSNHARQWVRGWNAFTPTGAFNPSALRPSNYVWQVVDWNPGAGSTNLPAGNLNGFAGRGRNNRTYTGNITQPLTWTPTCAWMASGQVNITPSGRNTRTITWGTTPLPSNWWTQNPPYEIPCVKRVVITLDGTSQSFDY